jgi:hypothetical protein
VKLKQINTGSYTVKLKQINAECMVSFE